MAFAEHKEELQLKHNHTKGKRSAPLDDHVHSNFSPVECAELQKDTGAKLDSSVVPAGNDTGN